MKNFVFGAIIGTVGLVMMVIINAWAILSYPWQSAVVLVIVLSPFTAVGWFSIQLGCALIWKGRKEIRK